MPSSKRVLSLTSRAGEVCCLQRAWPGGAQRACIRAAGGVAGTGWLDSGDLRICVANMFPAEAKAAGLGPHFESCLLTLMMSFLQRGNSCLNGRSHSFWTVHKHCGQAAERRRSLSHVCVSPLPGDLQVVPSRLPEASSAQGQVQQRVSHTASVRASWS